MRGNKPRWLISYKYELEELLYAKDAGERSCVLNGLYPFPSPKTVRHTSLCIIPCLNARHALDAHAHRSYQ